MEKIVITGGLGYIGTELCKLYSSETRYKNIIVTDNRFISERVKQLRDWGFDYVQTSVLDKDKMQEILHNADIVHHLAGITDVAYTKTQSNREKDEQIRLVTIEGTKNILEYTPKHCKIIFPSTHVVYEGFNETKLNITEDVNTTPILTYSKSKVQNENDIKESGKNYIILRLGSVYGYSTDTMRIGIMPNLFSKMTSQNEPIKLFGGGYQIKSLVGLIDVARCFKFMAESNIKKEIFHLTNENMTVKEVAEICKKYKPNVNVIVTNDEVPNLGYTLSNKKLLSTGFKFLYNIDSSINEMIYNWSKKDIMPDLEYIIQGSKEYIDERGKISNYELTEPINLIGYIESKKGTVRANHYHPVQEQKCLLIKGKYVSVIKDLADKNSTIECKLIQEGDLSVIKPNVAHTMIFLEDSIFLNLVRGEREHENYGITHTIPYTLVDENFKKQIINGYKTECRSCGNSFLKKIISLGKLPLANNLLDSDKELCETFPLEMEYCSNCNNVQLNYVVPANKMFDDYLYVSSTSKSFRDHFESASEKYIKKFNLNNNSLVVDIGSNDGIALKPLLDRGINVIGVEPAKNIAKIANNNKIPTLNEYFNDETLIEKNGKVDLITASNVFAHADDLKNIVNNVFRLLKENGTFIIEVQYLLDTIKDLTFDNIYHEHVNYWSVNSINNFFNNLNLKVYDVEHINTHGGSIRVYVSKNNKISDNVYNFIKNELENGLSNYKTYLDFSEKIKESKKNVLNNFKYLKSLGKTIVAYGSPAKATTSLNYYGIDNTYIDFTVEDNEIKHNKYIPNVNIPITSKDKIRNNSLIIILAWNFYEDIVKNNKELLGKNCEFINIRDLQNKNFIESYLNKKIIN